MGDIPPSDEWKHVDYGRSNGRRRRPFLNRKTLLAALQVLSFVVGLARFLKNLFSDV